jgi:hypothetical protein
MTGSTSHANMRSVTVWALLLVSGLAINYLLERYNVFKVWENSRYPISWADLLYPPLCVFLCLTGIVLGVGGAIYRLPIRRLLRHAAIVIPLSVLYTLFAFAMQFIQTGADRLGECPGLDQAAPQAPGLVVRLVAGAFRDDASSFILTRGCSPCIVPQIYLGW